MSIRFGLLALVVFTTAVVSPVHAQKKPGAARPAPAKSLDSARIAYHLEPGATVSYHVVAHDTLALYGGNAYLHAAERSWIVTFTCDSIVPEGMIVTMRYDGYAAREWRDSLPPVTRTSSPWTDAAHTFMITADGRHTRQVWPKEGTSVAPAGPFQPQLLPFLGAESTFIGSSEMFELTQMLSENAMPPTAYNGSIFRTLVRRVDTLGVETIEIALSETGQSTYEGAGGLATRSVINGASRFWFSPLLGLPVAGHAEAIMNLTLHNQQGAEAGGRQSIGLDYELVIRDEATR
jgi:hypothetical protein